MACIAFLNALRFLSLDVLSSSAYSVILFPNLSHTLHGKAKRGKKMNEKKREEEEKGRRRERREEKRKGEWRSRGRENGGVEEGRRKQGRDKKWGRRLTYSRLQGRMGKRNVIGPKKINLSLPPHYRYQLVADEGEGWRRWRLVITEVEGRDAGHYRCQVATRPPLVLDAALTVIGQSVHTTGSECESVHLDVIQVRSTLCHRSLQQLCGMGHFNNCVTSHFNCRCHRSLHLYHRSVSYMGTVALIIGLCRWFKWTLKICRSYKHKTGVVQLTITTFSTSSLPQYRLDLSSTTSWHTPPCVPSRQSRHLSTLFFFAATVAFIRYLRGNVTRWGKVGGLSNPPNYTYITTWNKPHHYTSTGEKTR